MNRMLTLLVVAGCFAVAGSARASAVDPQPAQDPLLGLDLRYEERLPAAESDLASKSRAADELAVESGSTAVETASATMEILAMRGVLDRRICRGPVEHGHDCWIWLPATGASGSDEDARNG